MCKIETTIEELTANYEYYMRSAYIWPNGWDKEPVTTGYGIAKGFTIGRGKKLYWYIIVSPKGFYYAYPIEERGLLGWRRQFEQKTKVTIHY